MSKKRGTDMIRPVPDGVKFACSMLAEGKDRQTFIAGVNWLLELNGHKPIKMEGK